MHDGSWSTHAFLKQLRQQRFAISGSSQLASVMSPHPRPSTQRGRSEPGGLRPCCRISKGVSSRLGLVCPCAAPARVVAPLRSALAVAPGVAAADGVRTV
eukprot:4816822-Prymnesium_polylepis.1